MNWRTANTRKKRSLRPFRWATWPWEIKLRFFGEPLPDTDTREG